MRRFRALFLITAVLCIGSVVLVSTTAESKSRNRGRRPTVAERIKHPESPFEQVAHQFRSLPRSSQIAVIKALRDFFSQWEGAYSSQYAELTPRERKEYAEVLRAFAALFMFGEEAWADEEPAYTCLYGGWGSVKRGKCPSPARTNKLYQRLFEAAKQAGKCVDGGFLCSPALFGPDLCLPPEKQTPATIQWTFNSCKEAFNSARRTLDQVVDHITGTLDGSDAMAQVMEALSTQCLEGRGDDVRVKSSAPGMCRGANARVSEIWSKVLTKYPDSEVTDNCYEALDVAKNCEQPKAEYDPRQWKEGVDGAAGTPGCGYYGRTSGGRYEALRVSRVKGKDGEVIIGSPSKSFLNGNSDNLGFAFYTMSGVTLTNRVKDVQGLVGVNGEDLAKLSYFDHRTTYDAAYQAMLNELTLQMQERTAELRGASASDREALKTSLAEAIQDCQDMKDPDFVAARTAACALGITGDGCPVPGQQGHDNVQGDAHEGN